MKRLFAGIYLIIAMTASAAPKECAVSGELIHWAADYCMYTAATDDFANPKVAMCFNKQPEVAAVNACGVKLKYKMAICTIVVQNGSYKNSVEVCVQDKTFSGLTVRNGGL